jgi:MFS family permease
MLAMFTNAPTWAMAALVGLSIVVGLLNMGGSKKSLTKSPEFKKFQNNYLLVYYIITLSDWLQGTHMWTLYNEYREKGSLPADGISSLFVTGFACSAVCSSILGPYVDRYGRKISCVIYCILELVINTLEHFDNFELLIVGRVLGGISTALLFSAFESWMVTEHKKRFGGEKESEKLLEDTFGLASTGNGLLGVVAGIMAQSLADSFGNIGPFQAAIALTAVGMVIIIPTWAENTAQEEASSKKGKDGKEAQASFGAAIEGIMTKPAILYVGLIQACFEGAMYTFVFNWVPSLMNSYSEGVGAFFGIQGIVFSLLMLSVSLGGSLFGILNDKFPVETFSVGVYAVAAIAILTASLSADFFVQLGAFLVVECCVGIFFAAIGTMRSQIIPAHVQSTTMNLFRVPLNILVVIGTKMSDAENISTSTVFQVCFLWFGIAAGLQFLLKGTLAKGEKGKKSE